MPTRPATPPPERPRVGNACLGMALSVGTPAEVGSRIAIELAPGENLLCNECRGYYRRWIVESDRFRHRD